MSLENNIRALERTPVLADIGREALRLLAFSVEKIDISDGQNLFTRGTPADCAYSVVGGRIRLDAGRGGECVVGPGTLIGEMALIVESERPCDAYGEGSARLLVIPRVLFRKMLDEYPQIADALRARLVERVLGEHAALARIRDDLDRLAPDARRAPPA